VLAREAAEIDLLFAGRMELGIGAWWARDEYDMVQRPIPLLLGGGLRMTRFASAE
jgi:alkanesulfonate monooxygenase SsuD/methylene tetrahydromethanopterin reductase-like flavin-dependent oxidoreductase (luciferase family)